MTHNLNFLGNEYRQQSHHSQQPTLHPDDGTLQSRTGQWNGKRMARSIAGCFIPQPLDYVYVWGWGGGCTDCVPVTVCPAPQARVFQGACPGAKERPRPAMTKWLEHLSTASGRNGQGRMWATDLLPSSWRGSSSCSHLCANHWAVTNVFPACRSLPEP